MNKSPKTERIYLILLNISFVITAMFLVSCADPPPSINPRIIQAQKQTYIQCEEINQNNLTFKCDPDNVHPLVDCDKNGGCIAIISKEMADLASWARRHASDTCKPPAMTNPIINK